MSPEHLAEEVGLSCGSEILTVVLGACRIFLIPYPFSLKVVLRNNEGFPLHTQQWCCAPRLHELLVCWKDGNVIQGSGRDLCGWVFSSL
jgi:hypothetical protein